MVGMVVVMMIMMVGVLVLVVLVGCVWIIGLWLRCGDRLVVSPGGGVVGVVGVDTQRCEVCLREITLLLRAMAVLTDCICSGQHTRSTAHQTSSGRADVNDCLLHSNPKLIFISLLHHQNFPSKLQQEIIYNNYSQSNSAI